MRWVIQLRGGEMRLNGMEARLGDLVLALSASPAFASYVRYSSDVYTGNGSVAYDASDSDLTAWAVPGGADTVDLDNGAANHLTVTATEAKNRFGPLLEKAIQGYYGKDYVVVFLNGASGDITQVDNRSPYVYPNGERWAELVGGRVGAEALKALLGMEPGSLVPVEARTVVGLLGVFGVHAAASGNYMQIWDRSGATHTLLISWNCIGWQSLILLGMSFFSGLRGEQPLEARVQIVFIGVAGTMLLNLMRVAAVAALAATWGQIPAELFHDYGGTILVVGWLFAFWIFVQRWLINPEPPGELEEATA